MLKKLILAALFFATIIFVAQSAGNIQPDSVAGCEFNSSFVPMTNKQLARFQCDTNGNLKTTGSGGGGGAITGPLGPTTTPSLAVATTDTGNPINGQTIPTGGQGITGWLSAIYAGVTGSLPSGTNNIGSITNITGTVTLPTGAATSALQTTLNTILGSPFQTGGTIGNTGFAVTGPLGSATAANAGVSENLPDEVNACTGGNTCSVTSAATLATVDMTGYASATITITANASGNTISFTSSDDNTNFVSANGLNVAAVSGTSVSTYSATAVSAYSFPKRQRYLRAAVTTFVSGTITITFQLHQNTPVNTISNPALVAGTTAVGKVGPGFTSAQTPVSISANGTTAAVTATMAAVANKTNWMCGFSVRAAATAATTGAVTITGILGGTMTFEEYVSPIATGMTPVEPPLGHVCISGSAVNTAIVLTAPAAGTGGITSANIWGYAE